MTKSKKKIVWIKMPVNLMDDERIAELVSQKGVSGFGVYIAIIGEMYRRQCRCLTTTQLKALKFTGATQKTIMAVVNDFGLFCKDQMGHVFSAIDFLGLEDEREIGSDADENAIGIKTPYIPSPARVYIDKEEDKDKKQHNDGSAFISQIPQRSQWAETAMMKSGFGALIERHWQVTIEEFRKHAIVNCTIEEIRSTKDAMRYFHFYITNPTSGNMLRKTLEEYERQHAQQNPFRFEDAGSCEGHRSYHGISLPDDAPPRPDERADWDYENRDWI